MKKSKLLKNVIISFGGQFIAIVLGLIVPRYFILSYGSDVNGFLSTIIQIFTYMALLEAGIGQAARNLLFKPFQKNDKDEISEIASIALIYYRRFTFVYGVGVVLLALLLPLVLKTNVDSATIILIVLFEGFAGVISFYFIETPSIILGVDGKNYINNAINLINRIVVYLVKIFMAVNGFPIVILQFTSFIITIVKGIVYDLYFKKYYSWIKWKQVNKNIKLKDRGSYIITEIASTVFNSTDMIVLSIFLSTQLASVYSVYNMVYGNIHLLLNAVYFSIVYILGIAFHTDLKKYELLHDVFTSFFLGSMTILMSVCYVLTIPFVSLYTRGVADIKYIYYGMPLMFSLVQILSWSRYVAGNLTGIAGYAKQTSYVSLIEAIINIVLSIILVRKFGIIGVLFATIIALPLKVVWCIYISDKKVMNRSCKKSVSILGINFTFFFLIVFLSYFFRPTIVSYGQFFVWGVILCIVFGMVGMGLNFLVNKDFWIMLKKYILKRK